MHEARHPTSALTAVVVAAEDDLRHRRAAIFRLDADEIVVEVLGGEVDFVLIAFGL
jgi:hypothetical protein